MDNQINKWQEKYFHDKEEYSILLENMKDNELAYNGKRKIKTPKGTDAKKQGSVSRKMCFELIETQCDVNIPAPRVISLKGREDRARMIESMLRNQIDRLDFEEIADEQARTTPVFGSSIFLLEWDNNVKTQFGVGELVVKNIHPEQLIPQDGVSKIDDMDYFFIEFEQTQDYILSHYGVDVSSEADQDMNDPKQDMRTHIYCYYKNSEGRIGLFSWVGNTIVQDYDDYFARLQKVCTKCGNVKPIDSDTCSCGNKKFETRTKDFQELIINNEQVKVKYYVPKIYPVVIRKNVAYLNQFLGGSDIDMIKDQQNDLNIYMAKIREKLLKGGSWITYPEGMKMPATDEELKWLPVKNAADKNLIEVTNVQPNTNNDIALLNLNYEIGRQTIGITDSFQGRADYTASSGKAKEIQAQQAAGRLESKKVMRDFAFSKVYEKMFKFILAFTDNMVPYVEETVNGSLEYKYFDKRFFIDQDEEENFYYDDAFVFSTDVSGTLANDRQAMWQETRNNFQSGAYGNPQDIDTLVMFWTTMNKLHYPGSFDALQLLQQRKNQQQQLMLQQQREQSIADAFAKNKTNELLKENLDLQNNKNNNLDQQLSNAGIGGEQGV